MKDLSEILLPEDREYTYEHVWLKKDGDEWLAGISDYAQDQLGEIVFVDLPQAGESMPAGEGFGTVESLKSVNTLYMPITGTIKEINVVLDEQPTLVNVSCYEKGWMIRFSAESTDRSGLMSAEEYKKLLAG